MLLGMTGLPTQAMEPTGLSGRRWRERRCAGGLSPGRWASPNG